MNCQRSGTTSTKSSSRSRENNKCRCFNRGGLANMPNITRHSRPTTQRARRLCSLLFCGLSAGAFAQSGYKVVAVPDGGSISGVVKWSGPVPHALELPITKDQQVCDPGSKKTVDLERLIVGANGGVANTVVYLKNITSGKALDLPQQRSHVDQKHCRYVPHILLVPEQGTLDMESFDAALHTVHMEGVASFNLPFPVPNRITSRTMPSAGLGHLRCNAGHVWMNAEMLVVRHPYYAVTNESGGFQ